MSNPFKLGNGSVKTSSKYSKIGFSRNPFTPYDDDDQDGPLYQGHLQNSISDINTWLVDSTSGNPPALSIKGSIGVGKTRLMKAIRNKVLEEGQQEHVHAALLSLGSTGYARPSIGQLLLDVIDMFVPSWQPSKEHALAPTPLVGLIVDSNKTVHSNTLLGKALTLAKSKPDDERGESVRLICRWLHRELLTAKQSEQVGLHGRLDYEGQLPDILGDLLIAAKEAGILTKTYLMIDQLEDLFRHSYSELRQSRMVTDMRRLIDIQDAGAPLGLVFAWSPDIDQLGAVTRDLVDRQMQQSYGALYTRLTRRLISIQKIRELHAPGFAEAYMKPFEGLPGNVVEQWPKPIELAGEAWTRLGKKGLIRDNTVTPRDLLTALAEVVEQRVAEE